MDFDSFLTSPRWEILQIIAEKPSSPIEIAEKLNTTVSYASQQLKLLDAAGLLIKEKTGAAEKGKPRTLFGLSGELVYLSVLMKKNSIKKLIHLDEHHKRILKIWLSVDFSLHYYIEKLFWKLEEDIEDIKGIFIDNSDCKVIIVSEDKKLKSKIESFVEKLDKKIQCQFVSESGFKKFPRNLISLYDPENILEVLKGGTYRDV
ncbi:ArsR family transcriptional regulator [Candidatus Pacearchaeota archaeon]|nr:ArsR family transcriptional regulator [Candidatus Pacearchaeota archaeon]